MQIADEADRKELLVTGSVGIGVYKKFLKAVDSVVFPVIVIFGLILAQLAISGADYFVSRWANWEEKVGHQNSSNNNTTVSTFRFLDEIPSDSSVAQERREEYIMVYTVIIVVGTCIFLIRSISFFRLCLRVSINLHDKLFRGISRARMLFFNNNPSGRILNRFSRDINNVDTLLPMVLLDVLDVSVNTARLH